METIPNIHSKELFEQAYGGRTAGFYAGLLSQTVLNGKPGPILDLGAGLGLFTELAHRWGLSIIGLEGSSYAVEKARERVKGIKMEMHDLGDPLPFKDGSFSNIVLNQVIEHIDHERYKKVLAESYRILEDDGRIFIYSPSRRNIKEKSEPTHINIILPSELKKDLKAVGFQVIKQPDSGFWFLPLNWRLLNIVTKVLLLIFPHDSISASANAIAKK